MEHIFNTYFLNAKFNKVNIDMQFSLKKNCIAICVWYEDKSIHCTPHFHLAMIVVFGYDRANVKIERELQIERQSKYECYCGW